MAGCELFEPSLAQQLGAGSFSLALFQRRDNEFEELVEFGTLHGHFGEFVDKRGKSNKRVISQRLGFLHDLPERLPSNIERIQVAPRHRVMHVKQRAVCPCLQFIIGSAAFGGQLVEARGNRGLALAAKLCVFLRQDAAVNLGRRTIQRLTVRSTSSEWFALSASEATTSYIWLNWL